MPRGGGSRERSHPRRNNTNKQLDGAWVQDEEDYPLLVGTAGLRQGRKQQQKPTRRRDKVDVGKHAQPLQAEHW